MLFEYRAYRGKGHVKPRLMHYELRIKMELEKKKRRRGILRVFSWNEPIRSEHQARNGNRIPKRTDRRHENVGICRDSHWIDSFKWLRLKCRRVDPHHLPARPLKGGAYLGEFQRARPPRFQRTEAWLTGCEMLSLPHPFSAWAPQPVLISSRISGSSPLPPAPASTPRRL